jgi:hypothetical protein
MFTPNAVLTKVSGTTAYGAGDLIANSGTAGSVVPLQWDLGPVGASGIISRVRVAKSSTTATAASFRLHLFSVAPVPANGDNGAFGVSTAANYIGVVDLDMSSESFAGTAGLFKSFTITNGIGFKFPSLSSTIYGLLQAIGTYTPTSAETFDITLEIV